LYQYPIEGIEEEAVYSMPAVEIQDKIHWIGVNDHTTDLFEGLWPITQEGVSYNSYLLIDQKKAIIDLAKSIKVDAYFNRISEIVDVSQIDYIVLNHMEPDHTGILKILRKIAPHALILCSPKARDMVTAFYGITDRIQVVEDGEEVGLGDLTLQFFMTPFVHWPETMMTYEKQNRILFSCDAFGSYGALRGAIFDDECTDFHFYEQQALRYYSNIVSKFSTQVLKAIDKLSGIPVNIIAPSHGLIWRKDPMVILNLYKKWAEYAKNPGEPGVTLLYGTMYGNTEIMMDAVTQGVSDTGIAIDIFDVRRIHASYILSSLWTKSGVIIGAPTYENELFPSMAHILDIAIRKGIQNKKVAYFGSYGWAGGALRELEKQLAQLKWQLTDTLIFQGGPTQAQLNQGREFGRKFGELIQSGMNVKIKG